LFKKAYEMHPNPIPLISWDEYAKQVYSEYHNLLKSHLEDESVFQHFFESHPSFVPGSFELFGKSGHYPHLNSLITQPEIGGVFRRKPDFMWLAQDSLTFCPIFIEIEKPSKRTFTTARLQSADFTQALDQINEWKMVLNNPTNIQLLYEYCDVPDYMRKKKFKPQYGLVFGMRSEYANDEYLTRKRAELVPEDVCLMSYDRLSPSSDCRDLLCSRISQAKYTVVTIPGTFRYNPCEADILPKLQGFLEAIDRMQYTTQERKFFLKERYEYWSNFGVLETKGLISTSDYE